MTGRLSRRLSIIARAVSACAVASLLVPITTPPLQAQRSADFLFQAPSGSFTFHAGLSNARANSEIFSFTSELLTLDRSDFSALTFGVEFASRITDRLDVFGSIGFAGASERSEFRDLVDLDNNPIEQSTRFARVPILAGARYYILPRGRSVGKFAWLPNAVAPHISAGVGALWYSFRQIGDFVDSEDNEIFGANLESSGWAPALHVGAGVDFALSPGLLLASEARYSIAEASMSEDFPGFDKIDLSGLMATLGLKIRF